MSLESTPAAWRSARQARDPRFDGRFFVGVKTTGIYCRPICPARMPIEPNVVYFASAAAAADAGFRPCLRCRPEVAPGSSAWMGTSTTVRRACHLIDELATDHLTVEELAARLGVGARHLRRLFVEQVGASPQSVVQTRRLHFAKQLVEHTSLSLATVALASGFGSIRRFNAAFRASWGRTPSSFRRPGAAAAESRRAPAFRLAYRPPYQWEAMLEFLARRAVPGVERVSDRQYVRTMTAAGHAGTIGVAHDADAHALVVHVRHPDARAIYGILRRVRRMFDLDADPGTIGDHLAGDPLLRAGVRRRPGLRIPGVWDPLEAVVRAVVGQQVSVKGAVTLLARIVRGAGTSLPDGDAWLFPDAPTLAEAPLERFGLTRRRAETIRAVAAAVAQGELPLAPETPGESLADRLLVHPGIGPWTAQYVAMRSGADPDAFPAGDLGLRRAAGLDEGALAERAERWRPWRSYAAMYLWMELTNDGHPSLHDPRQSRRSAAAVAGRPRAVRAAVRRRPEAD